MSTALPTAVWRGNQMGVGGRRTLSSGFTRLDAELPGGGWPTGMLTELIAPHPGVGELRLLIPLLRQITRDRRFILMLAPPHIPYAPALASFGIDLEQLIVVKADNAANRLWALEQSLRNASFGALVAWLPEQGVRPEHLRRLQLAAQGIDGPAIVMRPLKAQFEASPAPLRLLALPRPQQQISVQVIKRRGPVLAWPMMLDLPQPPSAIRLRPRSGHPNHPDSARHAPTAPLLSRLYQDHGSGSAMARQTHQPDAGVRLS